MQMRSPYWKCVGILGGMGAEAGVELARRLVAESGARTDAEQIPCLLFTNPNIPDRTTALLHGGEDPFPELLHSLRLLIDAGAELLCIPCNTAHAWHERLQAEIDVPIVHMVRTMAKAFPKELGSRVGVLCTSGLGRTGIYQDCCRDEGLEALMPTDQEYADFVMRAIFGDLEEGLVGLKGTNLSDEIVDLMWAAAEGLIDRGAAALWLACTEISLIRDPLADRSPVPVLDAMDELAKELARLARIQPLPHLRAMTEAAAGGPPRQPSPTEACR